MIGMAFCPPCRPEISTSLRSWTRPTQRSCSRLVQQHGHQPRARRRPKWQPEMPTTLSTQPLRSSTDQPARSHQRCATRGLSMD
jgi:hypothetical protein